MSTMSSILSIRDRPDSAIQIDPLADPKPIQSRLFSVRTGGIHTDDDPKRAEAQIVMSLRSSGTEKAEVAFAADNTLRTIGSHMNIFSEAKVQEPSLRSAVEELKTRGVPPAQMRIVAWKTWDEPVVRPVASAGQQSTATRHCIYALIELQIFLGRHFLELVIRLSGLPGVRIDKINWRTPQEEHDALIQNARKTAFRRAGKAAIGYVKQMKMEAGTLNVISIKDLITPISAHVQRVVDGVAMNESRIETEVQLEVLFRVITADETSGDSDQPPIYSDSMPENVDTQMTSITNGNTEGRNATA